ncbi:MAG: hypothetical protein CMO34_00930 [Verrucomicrobia bacterium]|nr:hypothetical protein [Verrucomicrobiota bacterium]
MRRFKLIVLLVFCALQSNAQNLIPNPSFEDTTTIQFGTIYFDKWKTPTKGSPDFFSPYNSPSVIDVPSNFVGYQEAKTGVAYSGILIYSLYRNNDSKRFREYLQNKLKKPLVQDSLYCLQLYVSLADSQLFASKNKLGVYFSQNQVGSNDFFYLPVQPQIMVSPDTFITEKERWVAYNFEYQAQGGEEYITIGNFTDSTEVDTLNVGGGSDIIDRATYYYLDDIYLGHCDSVPLDTPNGLGENTLNSRIKVYPNPTKEQLFISYEGKEKLQIQLYNLVGQTVESRQQQTNNQIQLSVGHLPKGIYLLEIIADQKRVSRKIIKQ